MRQAAEAMLAAGLLEEFHTGVSWNPRSAVNRFLPAGLRVELNRRAYSDELRARTRSHCWREGGRLASQALGIGVFRRHETGCLSVDAVFQSLDRHVARRLRESGSVRVVYAYEDGALDTFRTACQLGARCIYDLPIAYWQTTQRLLAEEAARLPEWEPTLVGTRDSAAKLERKTREMELADLVVCPSQFVLDSLPGAIRASRRCLVAEFGAPSIPVDVPRRSAERDRPLRLLFAGSLTQRKGLADLFDACRLLNRSDVELVVFGAPVLPLEFYRKAYRNFRYEAPRPHDEVLKLMQSCDVLVLPSIVEGRALVQQEALSCGLPLIVTPNTGGADLVEENQTGFLVPIRSPERIASKIAWLADHREALEEMRVAARAKAREWTWERYGAILVAAIHQELAVTLDTAALSTEP